MGNAAIDLGNLAPSNDARVVAAMPNKGGTATLYTREPDGSTEVREVPFQPWLLTSGKALAEAIPDHGDLQQLAGSGMHSVRVSFPGFDAYFDALKWLKKETGFNPSSPMAPYRVISDLTQQFLSIHPLRLFRDMAFTDLKRLQLDIETLTTPGYDFPNADRENDRIIFIALKDSTGWEACLGGPDATEESILKDLVTVIKKRDPDVIEGHNIFGFDLPFIEARCKRHKVALKLGRDGSRIKARSSRFTAAERVSTYRRYDIYGRHIIDTLHMVQLYDVSHRDLDSYGLKQVAKHFGVAAPDRTYVDGSTISKLFHSDPERLRDYAMDDVRETDAIARILSPSYFYQAQLVPFSYQNCVTRGTAARIDAMLVASYLRAAASIPAPQAPRPFQGGLTESLESGIFHNVWHIDVQSLYPSIIISNGMRPSCDTLNIFDEFLAELRRFRLLAKGAAKTAPESERDHFEALQSSFKILINSFYGYVGFGQGTFNDFDMAEAVTAKGREILQGMLDFLREQGAQVIEMDTDGLYFVPPPAVKEPEDMEERVQQTLPDGIDVDLDATYKTMFSYKSKNYALLAHDGNVSITGAALKSRGLEPFQREYMKDLITLLLNGELEQIPQLLETYGNAIRNHELPLNDLAKREVLSQSPRTYQKKLAEGTTRRSAAYELVLNSEREYKQGDQVAFYVTGTKKTVSVTDSAKLLADADPGNRDENVAYYLGKLAKLHSKLKEFHAG